MSGAATYVLGDVIIFVYEVSCVFWHYINIDEVSLITLKKLLQSAMELLQIAAAWFITKCDGQLLQIATAFLLQKCDTVYYKLRQYDSLLLPTTHDPRHLTTLNTCPLTRHSIKSFRRAQKWDHFAMVETNIELI